MNGAAFNGPTQGKTRRLSELGMHYTIMNSRKMERELLAFCDLLPGFSFRICPSLPPDLREEIIAEARYTVCSVLPDYDPQKATLRTFLGRCAYYAILAWIRKNKPAKNKTYCFSDLDDREFFVDALPDKGNDTAETVLRGFESGLVRHHLQAAGLTSHQQTVMHLRITEDLSIPEIMERAGLTYKQVDNALAKSRGKLTEYGKGKSPSQLVDTERARLEYGRQKGQA